jgi:hypothetical protein
MSNVTRISTISTTTLQRRAIKLRLDGLSLEQAGETLGVPTHVLVGHLIEALKRIPDLIEEEKWAVRTLELHRLDALQLGLWPKADTGDIGAIEAILSIMEHRAILTEIAQCECQTSEPL